ncbi:MAG: glycosyl hydrolase family 18 protein, partial [Saprospiraceae bacterium]
KQKIKVLFSIGGGSKHLQYLRLLQNDQRAGFIQNLVAEVLKYNVDGIDIDLEGGDITEFYEAFVLDLAVALRSHQKLITAAVAIYYKNQFTDTTLNTYDFVNIMSYDRTGPWRPEKPGPHATFTHAVEDLRYFGQERKMMKGKMCLGVPFYGYGFGPELTSKAISLSFDKIARTYAGSEVVDEWLLPDGKILYYNGLPTMIQKTKLANEQASGIMIWQVLGDAKGKKSLLRSIYKTAHIK